MRKKTVILNQAEKIFRVKGQGYTIYIQAPTKEQARLQLIENIGIIPAKLLTWTEVKKMPKGEEFL